MSRWSDLASEEVADACEQGAVLQRGPLNVAYRATLRGEVVFVRHRVIDDPEYGQQFAAEQLVYPLLPPAARGPELHAVVGHPVGIGPYAVFEYVSLAQRHLLTSEALRTLAKHLALVHSVTGLQLGPVGEPGISAGPAEFFIDAIEAEVSRMAYPAPAVSMLMATPGWRRHVTGLFADEPVVLCHGDVHPGNWIPDTSGRIWLLDWEAARFRVAAADFNQLHWRWMERRHELAVLGHYADLTGRDVDRLREQVTVTRVLWHLRTFNFYTLVHGEPSAMHVQHLECAEASIRTALAQAAGDQP